MADDNVDTMETNEAKSMNNQARVRYRFGDSEMEAEGPIDFVNQQASVFAQVFSGLVGANRRLQTAQDDKLLTANTGLLTDDFDLNVPNGASNSDVLLIERIQSIPSAGYEPPESFAEWATKYNLKTHIDHALAAAVYVCNQLHERGETIVFNNTSILEMYSKARWEEPKNIRMVLSQCADKMFFAEVEGIETKGRGTAWRVTSTGRKHLESLLKGSVA